MKDSIGDMSPFFKCIFLIVLMFAACAGSVVGLKYADKKWPTTLEEKTENLP